MGLGIYLHGFQIVQQNFPLRTECPLKAHVLGTLSPGQQCWGVEHRRGDQVT